MASPNEDMSPDATEETLKDVLDNEKVDVKTKEFSAAASLDLDEDVTKDLDNGVQKISLSDSESDLEKEDDDIDNRLKKCEDVNESSSSKPSEEIESADVSNSADYVPPIEDPYAKACKYMSKHEILELFHTITSDIVYRLPDDPLQFMIDEIEKLQEQDRHRKGVFLRLNVEKDEVEKINVEEIGHS